jgi:serine/threonine-protein kinase HipA
MKRTIRIHLGEEARPVGTLHHTQEGARERAAFEYDPRWLATADRFRWR